MIFWTGLVFVCEFRQFIHCYELNLFGTPFLWYFEQVWYLSVASVNLFIIMNSIYLGHPLYDILNGFGISLRLPQPPFYQSCGFYLRIYCSLIELTFSYIFLDLFVSFFCVDFCIFASKQQKIIDGNIR